MRAPLSKKAAKILDDPRKARLLIKGIKEALELGESQSIIELLDEQDKKDGVKGLKVVRVAHASSS